jgi:hypothetical protein
MLLALATRRRFASAFAFLIAAGGLGALLLYGHVHVGGSGPVPDMYDPVWYTQKTITAVGEAIAAVGAQALFMFPQP